MDNVLAAFLMQLVARSPTLLIYVVGLILALVFWRHHPRPCLLVGLAMSLALLASIVSGFLFVYLASAKNDFGWNDQQFSLMLGASNFFTATILNSVAIAMLLAAAFVSRRTYVPKLPPAEERTGRLAADPDTRIQA